MHCNDHPIVMQGLELMQKIETVAASWKGERWPGAAYLVT